MLAACAIGEQSVVANAMKAAGQNVQQEAADELVGTERHSLVACLARGAVILPAKGDATLVECQQSLVGDRYPVRIARQIGEHRGRPGEGAFGIDDPFHFAQRCQPLRERSCVTQCCVLCEELQPVAAMSLLELFEETTA